MTLEGTNTYLVGRDPATVIDPGPADAGHIDAVRAEGERRGGIGTVLLTHSHGDHADGVELLGVHPVAAAEGAPAAGLTALATPGHAPDHLCFLLEPGHPAADPGAASAACFAGDLILGEGSTFVPTREQGGSLAQYLDSLRRLRTIGLERIYPGHGPEIDDPEAKIAEYIEHRLDRERRLVAALERGERSRERLLAEVWDDVPEALLPAAGVVMQAHVEKLEAEGAIPGGTDSLTA
jgi:glyoxylase-like metal-dependent hydrolase (beta-lactamase superfamily II)